MKQKTLYAIWGVLYALCCALGFLPQKGVILTVFSVLFFLPGVLILADAYQRQNQTALRTLRYVSLGSLVLTLALLAASFASAQGSLKLGDVLHYILGIVSVPMFCSSIWALSLFLWACLFIASFPRVIGK